MGPPDSEIRGVRPQIRKSGAGGVGPPDSEIRGMGGPQIRKSGGRLAVATGCHLLPLCVSVVAAVFPFAALIVFSTVAISQQQTFVANGPGHDVVWCAMRAI